MRRVSKAIVSLLSAVTAASASADTFSLRADQMEFLRVAVTESNFAALVPAVDDMCRSLDDEAKDRERYTVEQRVAAATKARQCAEVARAAAAASTPFEMRAVVNEVLAPAVEVRMREEEEQNSEKDYLGLKWGLGVGYSFGFDDAVDEAEIVDGVVRVSSNKRDQPRALLEFHKYFWCNDNGRDGTRGCGPFVAVSATSDDVLAGVGLGFMWGRKSSADDTEGFSIGIGAMLDADVKDLADGFEANQPPPGAEMEVRFETESRWSAILFVTRTF